MLNAVAISQESIIQLSTNLWWLLLGLSTAVMGTYGSVTT